MVDEWFVGQADLKANLFDFLDFVVSNELGLPLETSCLYGNILVLVCRTQGLYVNAGLNGRVRRPQKPVSKTRKKAYGFRSDRASYLPSIIT